MLQQLEATFPNRSMPAPMDSKNVGQKGACLASSDSDRDSAADDDSDCDSQAQDDDDDDDDDDVIYTLSWGVPMPPGRFGDQAGLSRVGQGHHENTRWNANGK